MPELDKLLNKANRTYLQNFEPVTWFERAVFLGWYCSLGDCEFCYMSTQKNKIKKPEMAVRSFGSIIAEVLICNAQGWKIEFLTGGYDVIGFERLLKIVKTVKQLYKDELWLNVGVLSKTQLKRLKPFIAGVNGSVECVNPEVRKKVCPSKNLKDIEEMFKHCDELGLKKSITLIIGLGETEEDMPLLKDFIQKHNIDRVTFYALIPHKGTRFEKGPDSEYYSRWIAYTRIYFPKLVVISGTWPNRVKEVALLLKAGSNAVTKFPAIKLFNSHEANIIHEQAILAKRRFIGSLIKHQKINIGVHLKKLNLNENERASVEKRFESYIGRVSD